jgi:molybdopterin-synthase adenylyltransferase
VLPGVIGLIEATEAIKFLLGWGNLLVGRLLTYDAVTMRFREVPLTRNPKCPLSGTNPTIKDLSLHAESVEGGAACAVRPA